MGKNSLEERVEAIIQAVGRASPADSRLDVVRADPGDAMDRLADAIDTLMRRFQERTTADHVAHEELLRLRTPSPGRHEEPSREQLLLLSTLEEEAPDTIWFKDAAGRFLHVSKARVREFELVSADEVVGLTDFDLFTEEHARQAYEDEQRVLRTGEPVLNKEEKETWPDRPPTWVVTTRLPLRDRTGAIVGTCGISRSITDRKRVEERYRVLFNAINDSVFLTEVAPDGGLGRILDMNDVACQAMERSREDVVGKESLDFLSLGDGTAAMTGIIAELHREGHVVWESLYTGVAGERYPVEISSRLLDLWGERVIISTVRDLSSRKQLEENLERERALLSTLINNLPDYVSIKDTESRILITNPANAFMMRIARPEEAVGKTDLDFYPSEEAGRYYADEREIVRTGRPLINKEEESVRPNGNSRWTLTTKVPLRNTRGEIIGMVCTGRDITAMKQAEFALRREAIRRRVLFEEATDGIVVMHENLSVVEANASFARMLGYTPEEVLGLHIWDWDATVSSKEDFRAAWPQFPTEPTSFETRHRRKDGSLFDVEISINPAVFEGEKHLYCACRDITERKQAEERIHDLARLSDENPNPVVRVTPDGGILYANESARRLLPSWDWTEGSGIPDELRAEVRSAWKKEEKRTAESRDGATVVELTITPIPSREYINIYGRDVTEEKSLAEKFLQSQKMEAIGRFAGGIAHDFNNLLTVIGGYCDLAKQELQDGGEVKPKIDEISRAVHRAADLTARLLTFSRKQVLVPRVLDLNALVQLEQNILSRLVGEDIEVRTVLRSEAGAIKADPGQIEQVLMNLAINARDAMPRGGKLIVETSRRFVDEDYARSHPEVRLGDYACVTVSDTGHGMDREVLSHVFEPFFTTKDPGKGTGLGLSTVYGIVKQAAGAITCESRPGRGTTFTIYFPRTTEPTETAAVATGDTAALRGTETLLLVEDEEMVRRLTTSILQNAGYTVIVASGGAEALAAMASHRGTIPMAITDVVMPGMNGKELAEKLLAARPTLKVLFVSGYSGNAIIDDMLGAGVDFIHKPFTTRELLGKIREILGR